MKEPRKLYFIGISLTCKSTVWTFICCLVWFSFTWLNNTHIRLSWSRSCNRCVEHFLLQQMRYMPITVYWKVSVHSDLSPSLCYAFFPCFMQVRDISSFAVYLTLAIDTSVSV